MALEENGTQFTERIEVDEEQEVEVFRVPAHNNVEGADFFHDFKKVSFVGFVQKSRTTEMLPACNFTSALCRDLASL